MQSPFAIFRKHQKLLTVILTGLAMFAFVILGAVQDPANMPTGLIVIFVASALGAVGWVAGIRSKKSNEYGTIGLVLGAILAIGGSMVGGPPAVVKADTGNIDQQQFGFLQYEREAANTIIARAYYQVMQRDQEQFLQQPQPFQYHPDPTKDIVVGELLRREADQMGLTVSDESVNDYLASITQNKLTREDVKEIRNQLRLSESDLYNILRDQLKARIAAQFMYQGTTLPPESYWEFYKKLNVRESVGIVPLAVSMFVDDSAEPTDAELQELFDANRENYPDTSDEGTLEEGRPGFRQPRRVQLAYVEAAYDSIEKTVTPPTDEEIEAYYEEFYKTVPADALENDSDTPAVDGPALPAPEGETPATSDEAQPEGEIDNKDLPPAEEGDGESNPPAEETPPADAESETESQEGTALPRRSNIQPVAFFDDTASTEEPAAETEAASETPPPPPLPQATDSSETPAPETTAPAETLESPASAAPPEAPETPDVTTAPDAPDVPATTPEVRELDDELRSEITDRILRERTGDRMQELMKQATAFMGEIGQRALEPEDYEGHLSHEEALEKLKAYADEHGLVFVETPLLSGLELSDAEKYPIGHAVDRLFSDPFDRNPVSDVANQAFTSRPEEIFTRAQSVVQPETESRYAYWKIDDQEEYVPESLDDEGIREQVITAWRELKAREKAQTRASELVNLANAADTNLSESLAGQTITGVESAPSVSVLHPPAFSWLSKADPRMSPNPFMTPPPVRTQLRNIPGRIGDSFMETVFDEVRPKEAGIAHSIDKDYFYVVKVLDRTYGQFENLEEFREQFLKERLFAPYQFSDYPKLAQGELQQYRTDWSKELFEKHGVEIIEQEEPKPTAEDDLAAEDSSASY
ncbi:MAG: hypothetical protein KDA86_18565 [Planctomycetaceae bacterium]|nr:hypothetical protein [Planctomycetaceae bacterium]